MENKEQINDVITRGVENIYPSADFLRAKLERGEKLTIYLGIDPTGPTLHLGHAIALKKLSEFQALGCKIIMLIGDFTAMIGDPTDKKATRKQLTREEVLNNCKLYKKQASVFLNFKGDNPAELKYNSKWLAKMNFEDVLNLASKMTVSQMLERDMFENRMKEGRPIFLHEFMYPLMQGYDSVAMDVDGEVGGNDQTFNMLVGRNLLKELKNKEKFVLTMKLLTDNSGTKMGKTEGNMLSLIDDANMMYGKVMAWEDSLMWNAFVLCTNVDAEEIEKMKAEVSGGKNPRDIKMRLAYEIARIYYGDSKAKKAEKEFVKTFQKKETPDEMEEIKVNVGDLLADVLVVRGFVKSKSDFRRLVEEGAVTIDGEKISDFQIKIEKTNVVLKIGKKRFIKLI
ncbi:MAG TPA: tyrosine--tRNA ligase [Candidatus Paceibacterota bacterium]|nr:tyrosine--tRNA ligase [Candidatus Paceibacterota bacterium]